MAPCLLVVLDRPALWHLDAARGPSTPSFSIVSSPIRFIAAASSSLTASPSRSRNDPSIPDKARSRQRSSRYDGTPSSRERFSVDSPRSRRSTTSRLRPTLQRCPGARPPAGTCPMESVDGLRPPSLPTGPTKAADDSRKLSFMRAIPSRFQWTMWCPKKPGPAQPGLWKKRLFLVRLFRMSRAGMG